MILLHTNIFLLIFVRNAFNNNNFKKLYIISLELCAPSNQGVCDVLMVVCKCGVLMVDVNVDVGVECHTKSTHTPL